MLHILYRGTSNASGGSKGRPEGFSYDKCLENQFNIVNKYFNNTAIREYIINNHPM